MGTNKQTMNAFGTMSMIALLICVAAISPAHGWGFRSVAPKISGVDVVESPEYIVVVCDLPGVSEPKVEYLSNYLYITAEPDPILSQLFDELYPQEEEQLEYDEIDEEQELEDDPIELFDTEEVEELVFEPETWWNVLYHSRACDQSKQIKIPFNIDESNIKAVYENGVLTVLLPRIPPPA